MASGLDVGLSIGTSPLRQGSLRIRAGEREPALPTGPVEAAV
jgi:hypothetical protein